MTGENLWKVAGVPHRGWQFSGIEDLGDARILCEMCAKTEIRYAHLMSHNEYPHMLRTGCVCAENMCTGYSGKREEALVKKQTDWCQSRWREIFADEFHLFKKIEKYNEFAVYETSEGWMPIISRFGRQLYVGAGNYPTAMKAKQVLYSKRGTL